MKRLALAAWTLLTCSAMAASPGAFSGCLIGPNIPHVGGLIGQGSASTEAFTTANEGAAYRFTAYGTRDVKAVNVNFTAVTTPGTVTARIETIDGTSGKPTGTLYDAAATKQFTPTAGWNAVTFDTLPTAGMVAGTEYALVLIKDDAGTTCTLAIRTPASEGMLPVAILRADDASTRSNLAEVTGSAPIAYFTMEDDAIETLGCCPSAARTLFGVYGADRAAAVKFVLPQAMVVRAIRTSTNVIFAKIGTPAGDLRVRILDNANAAVSGTTYVLDKESIANINSRGINVPLPNVELAAGTYRVVIDSPDSANSSNCWSIGYATLGDAALQSDAFAYSESTDQSTTFTWTDYDTRVTTLCLELDSIPAVEGGGGGGFDPFP